MILQTITQNKTHILYGSIIIGLLLLAYSLFSRKPTEIVKTEYITKETSKNVKKKNNITELKTTKTKNPDGTVTIITERINDHSITDSSTKSKITDSKKEVTSFLNKYSVTVLYPLDVSDIQNPVFNPLNLQVIGGIRVFNFPILINVGTSPKFNQLLIGGTLEL